MSIPIPELPDLDAVCAAAVRVSNAAWSDACARAEWRRADQELKRASEYAHAAAEALAKAQQELARAAGVRQ